MNRPLRQIDWFGGAATVLLIATLPGIFYLVLFVWQRIDFHYGRREVRAFIADHSEVVERRLRDPRVHSFQLAPDPEYPARLLVEFDVEDKATHGMLEDDLVSWVELRFPPRWNTVVRSDEELGNNFGLAAAGMGMALEGLFRGAVAAAVTVSVTLCIVAWLCLGSRRKDDPSTVAPDTKDHVIHDR